MEIISRKEKDAAIVAVNGRMDAVSAPEFEKSTGEFIDGGTTKLIINLGGLEYISSAGLRSILITSKKIKEKQGTVFFVGLTGTVQEVFKMSGFYTLFEIFDKEEEALEKI